MSGLRVELDSDFVSEAPPFQAACGFTAEDYGRVLTDLLPRGWAWPRDPATVLMRVFTALAVEFSRVHARDCDLLAESYPGTAIETLDDWERVTGLPDPCLPFPAGSLQARRNAILFKLAARGGASKSYFIWIASLLGFPITISEFSPFRVGQNRMGDRLFSEDWAHVWMIHAPEVQTWYFRTGESTAGERLREWGNDVLECVLNRLKPAHTQLIFGYGDQP